MLRKLKSEEDGKKPEHGSIRVIEQNLAITHLSFGLKNKNYFVISFILVVL